MLTTHDLIRDTIARVAIAIDQKDWNSLHTLFTSDAISDFPAPIGTHTSITSLQHSLQGALKDLSTQHSLTTQTIALADKTAKVTTYATTAIVEKGKEGGGTHTSLGSYEDELVRDEFNGQERWRIAKRTASSFPG
ncbi:SnoaL-like domain-containing protein [Dendryphion nanum]|uniref:SnoaL-like domain-containing protein n=1 Tax=Dendryphion nanum TaxID=256645 RepID=A0A9P9D7L9_9PLEO|nr:SnoaL-like domain-containing protein [Dendryphion nanum]